MWAKGFSISELHEAEKNQRASASKGTHPAILVLVMLGIIGWAGGIWWLANDSERWRWGLWLWMLGFFGGLLAIPFVLRKRCQKSNRPPVAPCPACGESLFGHSDLIERTGRCPHCAALLDLDHPQKESTALLNLDAFLAKIRMQRDRHPEEGRLMANWFMAIVPSCVIAVCLPALLPGSAAGQFGLADALMLIPAGLLVGMFVHVGRRFGLRTPTERCPSCRGRLLGGNLDPNPLAIATGCCPHCRAALFSHAMPLPARGQLSFQAYQVRRKILARSEKLWGGVALAGMILGLAVGMCSSVIHKGSPNEDAELMPYALSMVVLFYGSILVFPLTLRRKSKVLGLRCSKCNTGHCTPHIVLFGECPRCRAPILHA